MNNRPRNFEKQLSAGRRIEDASTGFGGIFISVNPKHVRYMYNGGMTEKAIVAGGCFWGVQFYFDQVPGVVATTVGYTGGSVDKPTYEQVCSDNTGHAEATLIEFDPNVISYEKLLEHFFYLHDPTQLNRQGPDIGDSYRSAIFYTNDSQKAVAEKLIADLTAKHAFKDPIVTEVTKVSTFWPAEDYHQKFTEKTGRGACHVDYKPTAEGVVRRPRSG